MVGPTGERHTVARVGRKSLCSHELHLVDLTPNRQYKRGLRRTNLLSTLTDVFRFRGGPVDLFSQPKVSWSLSSEIRGSRGLDLSRPLVLPTTRPLRQDPDGQGQGRGPVVHQGRTSEGGTDTGRNSSSLPSPRRVCLKKPGHRVE